MRRAQEAFRVRKKAMQEAERGRLSHQEGVIEHMASAFMEFADVVLHSKCLQQDKSVMESLHKTVKSFVIANCSNDSVEPETATSSDSDAIMRIATTAPENVEAADVDVTINSTPTLPQRSKPSDNPQSTFDSSSKLPPTSTLPNPRSSQSMIDDRISKNVFGNGWLNQAPMPFVQLNDHRRLDETNTSPFSHKLLQHTLNIAYQALSGSPDIPIEHTMGMFEFALSLHDKEELLFNLRWFLGPGSQEMIRLASVSFVNFSKDHVSTGPVLLPAVDVYAWKTMTVSHGTSQEAPVRPFVNAQEVERYLHEKGARFLDSDTIEILLPHDISTSGMSFENVSHADANIPSFPSSLRATAPRDLVMDKGPTRGSQYSGHDAHSTWFHPESSRSGVPSGLWDFFSMNALFGEPAKPFGPIVPSPLAKPANEQADYEGTLANATYRLRASVLFRNLASISLCLTNGPGYNQKYIDQAIGSAIIDRVV